MKCLTGELEITFLNNYCRAGNLSALFDDNKLPEVLKPYKTRLQALYDSSPPKSKPLSNPNRQALDINILKHLVQRLNSDRKNKCVWMLPQEWCLLSEHESKGFAPVPAHAHFINNLVHREVSYSSFTQSPKNSFIVFKSRSNDKEVVEYGRIFSIFTHRRAPTSSENLFDTWLYVQCFPKLPSGCYNPFSNIQVDDIQFDIRAWGPTKDIIVRVDEVVAH